MFSKSLSEKIRNEDAITASDSLWVVCDGASSLAKKNIIDPQSDAAWLSHSIVQRLAGLEDDPRPLEVLLEQAALECAALLPKAEPLEYPSAAIAVLRKHPHGKTGEVLVLGDCSVLLCTKDGVLQITDPAIGEFDGKALLEMQRLKEEHGGSFLSYRPNVRDILAANRLCKNKSGGYWILDCSNDWKGHAITHSFDWDDFKGAALFSDGFEQLQSFESLDNKAFYQTIAENPQDCLDRLFAHQDADDQCERLHRLKKRDDTSLIFVSKEDL